MKEPRSLAGLIACLSEWDYSAASRPAGVEDWVMVTVHNYRSWDPYREDWFYPPYKCTAERIRERGEIMPDTAEEVDQSQLDAQGRYLPKPSPPETHRS